MADLTNAQIATRSWEAVAQSDIEALRELWAPGIVWHVTGDNPFQGIYRGVEAVLDYLADLGEAGEAYESRLDDVLVSKDRVLLLCHVNARRHGARVETDQAMLARIEQGKIAEVWTLPLDPAAFEGFWSSTRSRERENA